MSLWGKLFPAMSTAMGMAGIEAVAELVWDLVNSLDNLFIMQWSIPSRSRVGWERERGEG